MTLPEAAAAFRKSMSGYRDFWCVAGGWALDLRLGRQTRPHDDLEVIVLREEREELFRYFAGARPMKIYSGDVPRFVLWDGEAIEPEVIQLRIDPIGKFDFDLLLTPSAGEEWICRRDESIRRPLTDVVRATEFDLPVLAPEIVLLFKAKYLREKDRRDFFAVTPTLSPNEREWLAHALKKVHPGHPWTIEIERL